MVHVRIPESDILDKVSPDRANGETEAAGLNIFNENVLSAFDVKAIILIPNCAVMNPNIVSSYVEAIGVECWDVDEAVVVLVRSSGIDMAVSDFQAIGIISEERPVWRIV